MASLPLIANRQNGIIESREMYNVKRPGLRWVSPGKSWHVNADRVVKANSQDDSVMYDHIRKKSWTHNKYNPRNQSKVNRNWRPWKIDLDREQYNHLRIPVNHSVAWMAPTFIRRADKEQHAPDMSILEEKYIDSSHKVCRAQATPIDRKRGGESFAFTGNATTLVDDIIGRTQVSGGVFEKKMPLRQDETPIGMILDDRPAHTLRPNVKGAFTKRSDVVVKDLKERKPTVSVGGEFKDTHKYQTDVEKKTVKLQSSKPVLIAPNLRDKANTKINNEFDTTRQTQKQLLEATVRAMAHKNRNEGYHPTHQLAHRPQDDVEMFEVRTSRPTFDRHVPQFLALKS